MSLEELCDKAVAAGHNCSVTVSTGPVVEDPIWPLWLLAGLVIVAVAIVAGITFNDWQIAKTKRHDQEVREISRNLAR